MRRPANLGSGTVDTMLGDFRSRPVSTTGCGPAAWAAARSISLDVGAARAKSVGRAWSADTCLPSFEIMRPGTVIRAFEDAWPAPFPLFGPAENCAGRAPWGTGTSILGAGFRPTIAVLTLAAAVDADSTGAASSGRGGSFRVL